MGQGKAAFKHLINSRQSLTAWNETTLGKAAFPWPNFAYFHQMLSIRLGGFQPPCPKATKVHARLGLISCKKQREQRFFANSRYIRYCGSRVFNTLVGSGVKPQHNPTLALKITL